MSKAIILFLASKLSPAAWQMIENLAEVRKTTVSDAACFLLNTCAMVERERQEAERVPYVVEKPAEKQNTFNLVIAGSAIEFKHYLKTAIIKKTIAEEECSSYFYISQPHQFIGLNPSKIKLHYWGNYSQNPVMMSDEHQALRQALGMSLGL